MRDWSSDVCSSDLGIRLGERPTLHVIPGHADDVARPRQWGAGPHRMDRRPAGPRQDAFDLLAVLGETSNALGHQIFRPHMLKKIGRASCRERVCQYVYISGGAVLLKKTKKK